MVLRIFDFFSSPVITSSSQFKFIYTTFTTFISACVGVSSRPGVFPFADYMWASLVNGCMCCISLVSLSVLSCSGNRILINIIHSFIDFFISLLLFGFILLVCFINFSITTTTTAALTYFFFSSIELVIFSDISLPNASQSVVIFLTSYL